ncbi:uncharacterized protein PHACADRAFT_265672, partial [Phanerochaete carnosa HHB-10118-sp]
MAQILSMWPTSLLTLLPLRGSHMYTTRSGEPNTITELNGSAAWAHTDASGPESPDTSDAFSVTGAFRSVHAGSQILIVRSNDADASHWRSQLNQ